MVNWLQSTDICVVTGGGNGLGAAIIKELSDYGCQTVSLDVEINDDEKLNNEAVTPSEPSTTQTEDDSDNGTESDKRSSKSSQTSSQTISVHPTLRIKCDVTKQEDVDNARRIILAKFQRPPSVVILNAAIRGPVKHIIDADVGELERTFSVNLGGVVRSAKAFLPEMIQQRRGFIVTVASALGMITPMGFSAYGASKAGVIAFHEGMEREMNNTGVKCLLVCPGQLDTEMFSDVETPSNTLAPVMSQDKVAKKITKRIRKGKTRTVYAPMYVRYLSFLRAAPSPISRVARKVSHIDVVCEQNSETPQKSRNISVSAS